MGNCGVCIPHVVIRSLDLYRRMPSVFTRDDQIWRMALRGEFRGGGVDFRSQWRNSLERPRPVKPRQLLLLMREIELCERSVAVEASFPSNFYCMIVIRFNFNLRGAMGPPLFC